MLFVAVPISVDFDGELLGKRIDDRDAHPVKPAGDLVGFLVELPSSVQNRQDDFDGGPVVFLVCVDRDAPAVVTDTYRAVVV